MITLVLKSKKLKIIGNKIKIKPTLSVGQIHVLIRRRLKKLKQEESIFLFFDGSIYPMSRTISEIAGAHNTVEVQIFRENCFG